MDGMSSEIEAAGAAVTAGLAAAAIDGSKGHAHEAHGPCPNCGAHIDGNFCANCGQPAHTHRTLGHMVEEFFHGVIHFDSRAWKTLPLLLFRPGTLTHGYIHGKRARYISPLAMFLLAVFAMFFVFSMTGGSQVGVNPSGPPSAEELAEGREAVTDAEARLAEARRQLEQAPEGSPGHRGFQAGVRGAEIALNAMKSNLARMERRAALSDEAGHAPEAAETHPPETAAEEPGASFTATGYEEVGEAARSGRIEIHTGWSYLDKKIMHKLENPELAIYKIQNAAYKLAFLLAPISLPFVWLLFFWKRGMTLFDHTVYILYSLSFVSLLFIAISLVSMIPGAMGYTWWFWLLAGPVHSYFHLKGGYGLGWFSALWRMPILILFAGICMAIFLLTIMLVGFVG
jgi:hypothetical protein